MIENSNGEQPVPESIPAKHDPKMKLQEATTRAYNAGLKRFTGRNGSELSNSAAHIARILGATGAYVTTQSRRLETPPSDSGAYHVVKLTSGHSESRAPGRL